MRRLNETTRPEWQHKVESVGLTYHTHDGGEPYWHEAASYELTSGEIDVVETAIRELHALLIDTADEVVRKGNWSQLAIPASAIALIERSWSLDDFSLYGRFDFAWRPGGTPELLEYNADTPTSLLEASVAQWFWLQERHPGCDQFNSIHERLIDAWKRFASVSPGVNTVDFASQSDNLEDQQTVSYLMDTALQAGLQTRWSAVEEIGYDPALRSFVPDGTAPGTRLAHCFKLYPWEWLFREEFARFLHTAPTIWLEPPWKALLSNKAILALAWAKHPDHPNLLPTFFSPEPLRGNYVRKPKLSREGANVTVVQEGRTTIETGGEYGEDGYIYQAFAPPASFSGQHPVFGGWVVDHEPAGLGIRESSRLVTDNLSRFVPHFVVPR